jgi:hypothetical protein
MAARTATILVLLITPRRCSSEEQYYRFPKRESGDLLMPYE